MLTTAEANKAILAAMPDFGSEPVALEAATGRILRQTVIAERDQPPFDRVTMDGIAINFAPFANGERSFRIQGTQAAGDPVQTITDPGNCIEIMTGAVLPVGCDCVIPVERISVGKGIAKIEIDYEPQPNQFIHPRGSDHQKAHCVLSPGIRINAMDIAIIASCGLAQVQVSKQPRVHVISTGNELVPAGQAIADHQIRLSNGPAVVAMLEQQGFTNSMHEHLLDDFSQLKESLAAHLEAADVLVLSGGVSMGKADFVPAVLTELGVTVVFHKISQRPGKPMWFGVGPHGQVVFALPGNPVSTLVCCRHYVLPALSTASRRKTWAQEMITLRDTVTFKPPLTCFLPVKLIANESGISEAQPVPTNTSGDFSSLAATDGYIELESHHANFAAGMAVPLHRWSF